MATASPLTEEKVRSTAKPFLKWAGGKTQLLPHLLELFPANYGKFIEPFVGGGAVFFSLAPRNSIIGDSNEELIVTYTEVRDDVENVANSLSQFKNDRESFYKIRSLKPSQLSTIDRAARLIYLNKTCFNGLYR
ncbi:MAG: Dam family site-specific DNA-(adenine-N6)-methyltransferase [Acidobacteria bacterium]|nr:Dam family site-specific DNA-(adenine-N6)-methyltransferase [Acidobacteriota bacterium]